MSVVTSQPAGPHRPICSVTFERTRYTALVRRLLTPVLTVLLSVGGVSCDPDPGKRTVAEVEREYRALVDQGIPRTDARFRTLADRLDTVPKKSAARGKAEMLARQLRNSLGGTPPRPLAIASPGGAGGPDGGTGCVAEVERLGRATTEDERRRLREALIACRAAEARVHAHTHADPGPDAHAGHPHDGGTHQVPPPAPPH